MIKLPSGVNIENLINDLRIFSWEASEILLYYSQILKDSSNKSNILENDNLDDPVTLADLKVNELIIKRINGKYKNINWEILSEENVKGKYQPLQSKACKEWLWVLDPLDGTKDFLQGTQNYAMHLALNYKQRPYLGVVLIPERGELWIAHEEKVWCERKDNYQINPIFQNNKRSLKDMIIVTSKNHRNKTLRNLIDKIGFKNVVIMGSIGCKIASILRGESDIYICLSLKGQSSPKDWDFAAPEALLKFAGGAITSLDNEELTYGQSNFEQSGIIVASNNVKTHKNLCLEIKEFMKKIQ